MTQPFFTLVDHVSPANPHGPQGRGDDLEKFYNLCAGRSWRKVPGRAGLWFLALPRANVVFTAMGSAKNFHGLDILMYDENFEDFKKGFDSNDPAVVSQYIVVNMREGFAPNLKYQAMYMIDAMKKSDLWPK